MRNKLILFDWGNIVESHLTGYTCREAWQDLFRECGYKGNKIISGVETYHPAYIMQLYKYAADNKTKIGTVSEEKIRCRVTKKLKK